MEKTKKFIMLGLSRHRKEEEELLNKWSETEIERQVYPKPTIK